MKLRLALEGNELFESQSRLDVSMAHPLGVNGSCLSVDRDIASWSSDSLVR